MDFFDVEKHIDPNTPGIQYLFTNPWLVCTEKSRIYQFKTVAGFWDIFSNKTSCEKLTISRKTYHNSNTNDNFYVVINLKTGDEFHANNNYKMFLKLLLGVVGETFINYTNTNIIVNSITLLNIDQPNHIIITGNLSKKITRLSQLSINAEYFNIMTNTNFSEKIFFFANKNNNDDLFM
ncbi:hypothetical protein QLL95_gp0794 [Cotonvirus japonicus]|uniref:Uncharacterized protein n=1 Tax=Cotonvirus japonicus TaxID=2811091 RepID=A0ABM7NT73_9VIRU|nr:hypothetical protein QLL95_gp0794 [Cotonvirus japonicus]BCS83329.1 hypothetical protein [Cotonvirus japonicus]